MNWYLCFCLQNVNNGTKSRHVSDLVGWSELCCVSSAGPNWHFYRKTAGEYLCVRTVAPRNDWRAIPPPLDRSLSHVHTPASLFIFVLLSSEPPLAEVSLPFLVSRLLTFLYNVRPIMTYEKFPSNFCFFLSNATQYNTISSNVTQFLQVIDLNKISHFLLFSQHTKYSIYIVSNFSITLKILQKKIFFFSCRNNSSSFLLHL